MSPLMGINGDYKAQAPEPVIAGLYLPAELHPFPFLNRGKSNTPAFPSPFAGEGKVKYLFL